MCIFHSVSVFSAAAISLSHIVDLCSNLKGMFMSPEIREETNKYGQISKGLMKKPPCSGQPSTLTCLVPIEFFVRLVPDCFAVFLQLEETHLLPSG